MSNLGMGVMLNMLGGNEESVRDFKASIDKKITSLELKDNALVFGFEDGTATKLYDDGQSCCEHRYMHTDDDLSFYVGATLMGAKIEDGPSVDGEYGESADSQFLIV